MTTLPALQWHLRQFGVKLIASTRVFCFNVPRCHDRWSLRLMGVKTYRGDNTA